VKITTIEAFAALQNLMPQHCLIGESCVVPGLVNETFTKPTILEPKPDWQLEKPSQTITMNYKYPTAALTTCQVKSLFLHNIVFQHDAEFDIIFEKSLRKLMF